MALLAGGLALGADGSVTDAAQAVGVASTVESNVENDLPDILGRMLMALKASREEARPFQPAMRTDLELMAKYLASAEAEIEAAFGPSIGGASVVPPEAGTIDVAINPQTLDEYADMCVDLGEEAWAEYKANGAAFDVNYMATRLKTIRHLLVRTSPHNYRTIAGIGGS